MTVRIVLLDVMDTVLVDPFRDALRACTSMPLDELFARRDADLWPAFERGELDEAGYWAGWDAAGLTYDRGAFHAARRAGTRWVPGMPELLDELEGVVERVTASNYPVWIEELAREHLDERFERVLASHHLGVRKPDPAFFTRLLDEVGADAGEAVFVDDRAVNVAAAEQVGLTSHRFVDATRLRRWLIGLGLPLADVA